VLDATIAPVSKQVSADVQVEIDSEQFDYLLDEYDNDWTLCNDEAIDGPW
jgi:hypothetical protein